MINRIQKVHLIGFTVLIYYDAVSKTLQNIKFTLIFICMGVQLGLACEGKIGD
jgi:hypothetical protein